MILSTFLNNLSVYIYIEYFALCFYFDVEISYQLIKLCKIKCKIK